VDLPAPEGRRWPPPVCPPRRRECPTGRAPRPPRPAAPCAGRQFGRPARRTPGLSVRPPRRPGRPRSAWPGRRHRAVEDVVHQSPPQRSLVAVRVPAAVVGCGMPSRTSAPDGTQYAQKPHRWSLPGAPAKTKDRGDERLSWRRCRSLSPTTRGWRPSPRGRSNQSGSQAYPEARARLGVAVSSGTSPE
jgi:hypothetical protein